VMLGGKGVKLGVGVKVAGRGVRSCAACVWSTITIAGPAVSVGKRASVGSTSFDAGAHAAISSRLSKLKNRFMKTSSRSFEHFN
jgi:hypothetical protein